MLAGILAAVTLQPGPGRAASVLSGSAPAAARSPLTFIAKGPDTAITVGKARTGSGLESARGWIRQLGGGPSVVIATLTDPVGRRATSAPLHLSALWQTFGVTQESLGGPSSLPLTLTIAPAAGSSWPANTRLQVSGVEIGAVGRSTLIRQPGSNVFVLTRSGERPYPFLAHGFLYWPQVIGGEEDAPSWADPATCQADAQILRGLGVTLVQANLDVDLAHNAVGMLKCADAFWAAGIGIAWLSDQEPQRPHQYSTAYAKAYEAYLGEAISILGDHPATYMWLIGNEEDQASGGRNAGCFYDYPPPGQPACSDYGGGGHYLSQFVDYLHENDAGHPVSTKVTAGSSGCNDTASGGVPNPNGIVSAKDVPALDFWSVDNYPASTFGGYFSCLQQDDPTRPALVSEFGNARLYCPGRDSLSTTSGYTTDLACPPGSHEDDGTQALANAGLWQDIVNAEATPDNPDGELLGGTEFMYSDLWWIGLEGPPVMHQPIAYSWTSGPNGWLAVEWEGGAQAQLPGQGGDPRVTTPELAAVARVWGPATPPLTPPAGTGPGVGRLPFVGNVHLATVPGPNATCAVDATWSTAAPATSRVDWGQVQIVTDSGGDLIADNTAYTQHRDQPALTESHDVTVTGPYVPGTTYRFVVRGFDADYGSDASPGIDVTIPSGGCG
jgi:hypothetical protein